MINGRLSSKILIFRAAYNKRGATYKHPMPRQACSRKAFRASFTLGAALCLPPGKTCPRPAGPAVAAELSAPPRKRSCERPCGPKGGWQGTAQKGRTAFS